MKIDPTAIISDLCCGAGLGADGYTAIFGARAVHGFDLFNQPNYPYPFTQADATILLDPTHTEYTPTLERFPVRHCSFPCQDFTTAKHLREAQGGKSRFGDLLTPGLKLLRTYWNDQPWIVENVEDNQGRVAKIMAPEEGESLILLCGSMFGLEVQRHRLFLANFPLRQPAPVPNPPGIKSRSRYRELGCDHRAFPIDPASGKPRPWGVWHVPGDSIPDGGHTARDAEHGRHVMGSRRLLPWDELKEGFPPAYTSWVGADLLVELRRREAAA